MSDLSRLSDEDLMKALQAPQAPAKGVQGMSDDDLLKALGQPKKPPVDTMTDAAKSYGVGVGEGAIGLMGLPGDISNILGGIQAWATDKFGRPMVEALNPDLMPEFEKSLEGMRRGPAPYAPTSPEITKTVEGVTGEFYKPQTTAGEYARAAGQFTPGIVGGGASLPARAVTQVAAPALLSEAAGQYTKGTDLEPYARAAGGLVGGAAPAVARRAVTPLPVHPERARQVQTLRNEGVDVTGGQASGRRSLRNFEDELGGGPAGDITERQGEQFTAAALRRIGVDANRATPEVLDDAFTRIGQQFDDLAARNQADIDPQFIQDVTAAQADYHMLANPLQRQVFDEALNNVVDVIAQNNGTIPGPVYSAMRSRLDKAARGSGGDVQLRDAYYGLRNALDDAMERTIGALNPDDLGAWRDVRNQYRNILVVEKAATGAGESAALGIISPSQLRNATVGTHGRRNYARGQGDFGDLARAGEAIMKPLPNSGTPGRTAARNIGQGISTMIGAGVGGAVGGGGGAAAGALAGAALPPALARLALSPWGRAYLSNQLMANAPGMTPGQAAFQVALASREARERVGNDRFRKQPVKQ